MPCVSQTVGPTAGRIPFLEQPILDGELCMRRLGCVGGARVGCEAAMPQVDNYLEAYKQLAAQQNQQVLQSYVYHVLCAVWQCKSAPLVCRDCSVLLQGRGWGAAVGAGQCHCGGPHGPAVARATAYSTRACPTRLMPISSFSML
jgi:hypothetical protein